MKTATIAKQAKISSISKKSTLQTVKKTKVFTSGNSQVVRIPKDFRFTSDTVEISKEGNKIILREAPKNLMDALMALPKMSDDFFAGGRDDPPCQERDWLQ